MLPQHLPWHLAEAMLPMGQQQVQAVSAPERLLQACRQARWAGLVPGRFEVVPIRLQTEPASAMLAARVCPVGLLVVSMRFLAEQRRLQLPAANLLQPAESTVWAWARWVGSVRVALAVLPSAVRWEVALLSAHGLAWQPVLWVVFLTVLPEAVLALVRVVRS